MTGRGHGEWPPAPLEALLAEDWELWRALGPLGPDRCECEAVCECDQEEPEA